MDDITTVTLGSRTFPVVPQKHARVRKYLNGEMLRKVMSQDYSHESYSLLTKMIPAMLGVKDLDNPEVWAIAPMPEWEYDGFTSEEAWRRYHEGDDNAYDEDNDPGPTTDQIVAAFETILKVNGANRLGKLTALIQAGAQLSLDQRTATSPGSLGANGVSTSESTGTQAPTS